VGKSQIFEITTYRSDDVYTNSRHPDQIKFSDSIFQDSLRRDFTINAMYADLRGYILDPQNGFKDLEQGRLKTVGHAEDRFQEDALRVLRAFRFVSQLGFTMEPSEQQAAIDLWSSLSKVSSERIYVEVKKMISGEYFFSVLPLFFQFNLFEYFVESHIYKASEFKDPVSLLYIVDRLKTKATQGIEEFLLEYAFLKTPQYALYLKAWILFLPFRKSEKLKIESGIHWMRFLDRLSSKFKSGEYPSTPNDFDVQIGAVLRIGLDVFELSNLKTFMTQDFLKLFDFNKDFVGHILNRLQQLDEVPKILVQGKHLMGFGVKPGPELRMYIERAFELQLIEPNLNQTQIIAKLNLKI
jgi:tRNA nucleotidyltransferase/poly(A) polymerase